MVKDSFDSRQNHLFIIKHFRLIDQDLIKQISEMPLADLHPLALNHSFQGGILPAIHFLVRAGALCPLLGTFNIGSSMEKGAKGAENPPAHLPFQNKKAAS